MPNTPLASHKGRRRRRRSNSLPSRGFEFSPRPFLSSSSEGEDEVDEKAMKRTPPRPLHRRSRRYTADSEGSSFLQAATIGSPEESPELGPTRATRRVTLDEENAFGSFGADAQSMPSDSGLVSSHANGMHRTAVSLHFQACEQHGRRNVHSTNFATDSVSGALPTTLPSWLFEVADEDLPESFSASSLFAELNMDPSHSLAKAAWVLLGAWCPRTDNFKAQSSTPGLKWWWVHDYNPAMLALGNDFWGSFTMLVLYSMFHYHHGCLKVLPWALLVWVVGSSLLWFFVAARRSQQHHLRAKTGPGLMNRWTGKINTAARHSTANFSSFAVSATKERESTTSLSEYEDCAGAAPLLSSAQVNQARPIEELDASAKHVDRSVIEDTKGTGQSITMMQMMGTLAYCSLPLSLVVGSLSFFRLAHSQPAVTCSLQFIGVVWASRAATVVLSARAVPQVHVEHPSASIGCVEEAASSSQIESEADCLLHAADKKVMAYPIVLFYIYLLSLYKNPAA